MSGCSRQRGFAMSRLAERWPCLARKASKAGQNALSAVLAAGGVVVHAGAQQRHELGVLARPSGPSAQASRFSAAVCVPGSPLMSAW